METKTKRIVLFAVITTLLLSVLLFPTSAYVYYPGDNTLTDSYINPAPFSVYWKRNNTSYYYNSYQNYFSSDYSIESDTNLHYYIYNSPITDSSYNEYNPYGVTDTFYQLVYRRGSPDLSININVTPHSAYYDFGWILPSAVCMSNEGYTDFDVSIYGAISIYDGEYLLIDTVYFNELVDERGFTMFDGLYCTFYNVGSYVNQALRKTDPDYTYAYIHFLNITSSNAYGCGYVTHVGNYVGYNQLYNSTPLLPDKSLTPNVDFIEAITPFISGLITFFNIEIIPGISFSKILAMSIIIPVGIKLIRST